MHDGRVVRKRSDVPGFEVEDDFPSADLDTPVITLAEWANLELARSFRIFTPVKWVAESQRTLVMDMPEPLLRQAAAFVTRESGIEDRSLAVICTRTRDWLA
jgi:hypothetical protein